MDDGKITKSDECVQPGAEVPADVYDDFKSTVADVHGNLRGNVGTALEDAMRLYIDEYGDVDGDPFSVSNADIYAKLYRIEDAVSNAPEHTHTRQHEDEGKSQTERHFEEIVANLPDKPEIYPSDVKTAVYDAGYSDDRTVDKYRDLMETRGVILPHPVKSLLPEAGDDTKVYLKNATNFAVICETMDSITPAHIDRWLGELEERGVLSTDEYRDALPPDFRDGRQLKIDQIRSGSTGDASAGGTV